MVKYGESKATTKKNGEPHLTEQEKHNGYMGRKVGGKVTVRLTRTIPLVKKILEEWLCPCQCVG
jgi:hypothetical protein